tara:strand:- start:8680 stop:9660 length:981 start_codon:yes stop_codon:yes gene_type:complete
MKIICTTPLNHLNDLNKKISSYGELFYKPNIKSKELKAILVKKKIDVIFCNPNRQGYVINSSILKGSYVRAINTASTGLNHINIDDCKKLGVKVYSLTKDFSLLKKLPSTSELSFGLMINLLKNINKSHLSVTSYKWNYLPYIGRELSSLTIGIIGYGRLGKFMAKYCKSFGMKVLIYDPYKNIPISFRKSELNEILNKADVISLHVHVKKDTKYMISNKFLNRMKKAPIIINSSRGEIVCEKDIISSLELKKISGYGADVLEDEFGDIKKSPIIKGIKKGLNIIVTPHVGGMTIEGQYRAWIWAINKFKRISKDIEKLNKFKEAV